MTDSADAPPAEVTIREITELVRQFDESGWASLELDIHGMHLVLGKKGAPVTAASAPAPAPADTPARATATPGPTTAPAPATPSVAVAPSAAPEPAAAPGVSSKVPRSGADLVEVRSPVVGAFWVAPSPGEPPFVQVGDTVTAGQQLAIVEVMKLMSDVSAAMAGTVVEVLTTNSEMVEYDQVLFLIDPGAGSDG